MRCRHGAANARHVDETHHEFARLAVIGFMLDPTDPTEQSSPACGRVRERARHGVSLFMIPSKNFANDPIGRFPRFTLWDICRVDQWVTPRSIVNKTHQSDHKTQQSDHTLKSN
jgi:hypothetical protein